VDLFKVMGDQKMVAVATMTHCNVLLFLTMRHQRKQDWMEMIRLAHESEKMFQTLRDKKGEAKALHMLALIHVYQKDIPAGILCAKEAVEILSQLEDKKQEACELYFVAQWQFDSKNVDNALAAAEQAVTLFEGVKAETSYDVSARGLVIKALMEKGESQTALRLAQECVAKFAASKNTLNVAASQSLLAEVLYASGNGKAAFTAAVKAVGLVSKMPVKKNTDRIYEAKLLQKLAWLHLFENNFAKAEQFTRQSLAIVQDVGDETEEGIAFLTLCNVAAGNMLFGDAMYAARQAHFIFTIQGNSMAEAVALMNIAQIHFKFNRLRKAELVAKQAQVLFAELGSMKQEADALYLLSHIYLLGKEYAQTLSTGKQAVVLWRDVFDDQAEFNQMLLMCQASLFMAMQVGIPLVGEQPKAEWAAVFSLLTETKAKGNSIEANRAQNVLQACFLIGQANYGMREYAKATKAVDEGSKLAKKCKNKQSEGHMNLLRAYILMSNAKKVMALAEHKKAADIFAQLEDIKGESEADKFYLVFMGVNPPKAKAKKVKEEKGSKKSKKSKKRKGDSSEDEMPQKKKKEKKPKAKKVKKVGGGVAVEVYKGPSPKEILDTVKSTALDLMGQESLEDDAALMEAGLDSLAAVEFGSSLAKQFTGVTIPSTMMFDMPTTKMISEHIAADLKIKMTVTEIPEGDDEEEDEEDDSESDEESSEEEKPRKKKTKKEKKPKAKKVKKAGGGVAVEVYKGPSPKEILDTVKSTALDLMGQESLEDDAALMEAGLDSLAAVEFGSSLAKQFTGVTIPSTMMFDMPTTKMISEHIAADLKIKMTVTEIPEGDDEEEDEEDDSESDEESSEDEKPIKKSQKPKTKSVKQKGAGVAVEVYKGPSAKEILDTVKTTALDLMGQESLEDDAALMEAGLDSLAAVEFGSSLAKQFTGVTIPSTMMFDMPTTKMISEHIAADLKIKMTVTEIPEASDEEDDDSDDSD